MASRTILVVDDDIELLTALSKLLGHFGYVVAGASNSEAAMNYVALARNRFDVIVTDLAMPGIDGLTFMTAAKKEFPDVPVIVMTGHMDQRTADEVLRLGAYAYLAKPLDTQHLVITLERALRSSASARR
jgi:two-component system response regulator HydG